MDQLKYWIQQYREIISYLFWGVMTTVVSWASYSVFALVFKGQVSMVRLLGMEMSMVVLMANILSWIFAIVFAFVVNKLWVFQSKSWKKSVWIPELWKFLSARVVTGILEIVVVPLLVGMGLNQTIFGVEGMVAKVLVSVGVVLLNYVFSKLFIFR
ncbi:MAG: GtrA family protein [Lachnospiraceae bacterium]|nr:GtrA family protein [Lachnospiraceae bacterium]